MEDVTVTCICGHEATFHFYGAESQRESFARSKSRRLCAKCGSDHVIAEAEGICLNEFGINLRPLSGSAGQTGWANKIRARIATVLSSYVTHLGMKEHGLDAADTKRVMEWIFFHNHAWWWIEHSESSSSDILAEAVNFLGIKRKEIANG